MTRESPQRGERRYLRDAVTYELEAINILRLAAAAPGGDDVMRFDTRTFGRGTEDPHCFGDVSRRIQRTARCKATVRGLVSSRSMNNLDPNEQVLIHGGGPPNPGLPQITPMTAELQDARPARELHADRFPGNVCIDDLCTGVQRLRPPIGLAQKDLGIPLDDTVALRELLLKNP